MQEQQEQDEDDEEERASISFPWNIEATLRQNVWQVKCPVVQAFRFVKDKAKLSSQVNVRMQTIETLCLGVYIYISYYVCTIYMIHNIVIYTYIYKYTCK